METPPQDVDLGGSEPSADPLADVPAESEFDQQPEPGVTLPPGEDDTLPPGVEQGELGGFNPSDDPDPLADPQEGEFLEDPEDDPEPVEPIPDPVEPVPDPEPEPVEEPDPEPTGAAPEADTALPITPVQGDPEPVEEAAPVEPEPEEDPIAASHARMVEEEEAAEEPDPEPATPVAEEEPTKETPKPKRRRAKKPKELPEGVRQYVPFRQVSSGLNLTAEDLIELAEAGKLWIEEKPVDSRSGEYALRKTFRKLSPDTESSFVLAAVPSKLWKPKAVAAQRRAQTSISVG